MSDLADAEVIAKRYRLLRVLGSGATGTVYLAERVRDFEQRVALKLLRWSAVVETEPKSVVSEQVILRSLEHPNIAALLDYGRMPNGAPFLVLEYLDGVDIEAWCKAHRLSVSERLQLLLQVFSAVAYAHSRLVLHGDIKAANVMAVASSDMEGSNARVKLLDFGMSRWLDREQAASGSSSGTTAYSSPELLGGESLTVAADIFALGVLMRNLLAGVASSMPNNRATRMSECYAALDSGRQQEIALERGQTPQALTKLLRGPLDAIVDKATASAPEDRYASATAMAEDVKRYLANVETSVYPLGHVQQTLLWMQRHAWLTALSVLLTVILLTGGGLTLYLHHEVSLQERATRAQLLELAHLTDDLSGTLYRSTEPLKGSEQARLSLLHAASAARDSVASENSHDPVLSLELARQYADAAELELIHNDKLTKEQAARELSMAARLLTFVPAGPAHSEVTEKINRLQRLITVSS